MELEFQVMAWDGHTIVAGLNTDQDKGVKHFLQREPNYLLKFNRKICYNDIFVLFFFIAVGHLRGSVLMHELFFVIDLYVELLIS